MSCERVSTFDERPIYVRFFLQMSDCRLIYSDMLHASPRNANPKRTRFPGITADARLLGVHRVTLYKMLSGYPGFVGLKTLRTRYDDLQRAKATA